MKLKPGGGLTTKEDPAYRSQYLMLNQGVLLCGIQKIFVGP